MTIKGIARKQRGGKSRKEPTSAKVSAGERALDELEHAFRKKYNKRVSGSEARAEGNGQAIAFDDPPGLVERERAGERALDALDQAVASARRRLKAPGYADSANAYKAAADAAQTAAAELLRTATYFELTAALARQEGMVDP